MLMAGRMPQWINGSRSRTRKVLCFSIALRLIKCVYAYAYDFTDIAHQKIFTDANVRDPPIANKVNRAAEEAYEAARNAHISLTSSVELALELTEDNMSLGYYFADHEKHVIFWFEDHKALALVGNVRGVESKSHVSQCFPCRLPMRVFLIESFIGYALESQYWCVRPQWYACFITCRSNTLKRFIVFSYLLWFTRCRTDRKHIELFPNKHTLLEDDVVKLSEIVMHAHAGKQSLFIALCGVGMTPY